MTHPYADKTYAESFMSGYLPIYLPQTGGYVLRRAIDYTDYYDAIGVYPLMPLSKEVEHDFDLLRKQGIISLTLLADPFFSPSLEELRALFNHVLDYKIHYLHRLDIKSEYSRHHRYEVKQARKHCELRVIALQDYLEEWNCLYRYLIERHDISGIQNFSENYFAALAVMNPVMIGAFVDSILVSAHLWFEHNGYVYSHLAASSEVGYRFSAAYAVYDESIDYFASRGAKIINLGGGAGIIKASDGLTWLKKGFSNDSVTCYLCGKILDDDIYNKLSGGRNISYFPAYRA